MRKKTRKKRNKRRVCRKPHANLFDAVQNFRKFILNNWKHPYAFHLASKISQTVVYQLYNGTHYPKAVTLKRIVDKSDGKLTLSDLGVE